MTDKSNRDPSKNERRSEDGREKGTRQRDVRQVFLMVRRSITHGAKAAWHHLPLPSLAKQNLKTAIFRYMPRAFRGTAAYRDWQNFNVTDMNAERRARPTPPHGAWCAPETAFVARSVQPPLDDRPARVIAFYLPQFHSIAENDAWWGEGFTEWTNVRAAEPQFAGHQQPHVPGELGYYDLRDTSVQRRQIELAKQYGIDGFCFYFYWFGGKRLLEKPVENWLADRTLDLPFCLCWANENWSRRWDGRDQEILIAQDHSADDDLAFIAEASRYMRDPRYIRIGGKPLLLVYRPSLLPSASATAQRWRQWCRTNGIGDIVLAYTQSFEATRPSVYGFDAAVEFPPNNSAPPRLTDNVEPLHTEFAANVYDWSVFPARSASYRDPTYMLFRTVCPGWDNTARRKKNGTVFVNNTPLAYRQWLENALRDTVRRAESRDERLVFVNAWNEWAEGAHLEPDAVNGYAYLQATRDALTAVAASMFGKPTRVPD